MRRGFSHGRGSMPAEPENTPPVAGDYTEPGLQGDVTQDPNDLRAEKGKL